MGVGCSWIEIDGRYSKIIGEHNFDAIEHLPDCTGFDWEPKPHQWKVGDWFVVDEKHCDEPTLHWHLGMDKFVGLPMVFERWTTTGNLKSNGWSWHPSWCRPCDPPKAEPSSRFQPSIEYVGIHDEE